MSNDNQNGYQFVIKARVNDDQKDPTQSCERKMTYQLVLKSKVSSPIRVHYFITSSPYDHEEVRLRTKTKVYRYIRINKKKMHNLSNNNKIYKNP